MPDDDEDLRELLLRDGDLDLDAIGGGSNLTAYLGATTLTGAAWGADGPGPTFYDPNLASWDLGSWWSVRHYPVEGGAIEISIGSSEAVGPTIYPPIDFYVDPSFRSISMQSLAEPNEYAFLAEIQQSTRLALRGILGQGPNLVEFYLSDDGDLVNAFYVRPNGRMYDFAPDAAIHPDEMPAGGGLTRRWNNTAKTLTITAKAADGSLWAWTTPAFSSV